MEPVTRWRCRIELWTEVTADSIEEAKYQAIDDLAFGRVSVAEAEVTDVIDVERPQPSAPQQHAPEDTEDQPPRPHAGPARHAEGRGGTAVTSDQIRRGQIWKHRDPGRHERYAVVAVVAGNVTFRKIVDGDGRLCRGSGLLFEQPASNLAYLTTCRFGGGTVLMASEDVIEGRS